MKRHDLGPWLFNDREVGMVSTQPVGTVDTSASGTSAVDTPESLASGHMGSDNYSLASIRQAIEEREDAMLHPLACRARLSQGRREPETPCPLRTAFQQDRDRILHSKAFRRLKHKTQVFISPRGDHYRTRLTHTLEVSQVARTLARALRLNEDLTEAIALAHDLGHPPFGHTGETVINQLLERPSKRTENKSSTLSSPLTFSHEAQSVRIATLLEPLNLTEEVLNGIEAQAALKQPQTLEAALVKIADRMAYLHHDVEDAIRAGFMEEAHIPTEIQAILGMTRKERLERLVMDLVQETQIHLDTVNDGSQARIQQSPSMANAMMTLRQWMFQHVYFHPSQRRQHDNVARVLTGLFNYFEQHPNAISRSIPFEEGPNGKRRQIVDHLASMTDSYALQTFQRMLLPSSAWLEFSELPEPYCGRTEDIDSTLPEGVQP